MADRQHAPRVPAPPVQQPAPAPRSEPAPRASAPVHHSGAAARASATGRFLKGPPTVRLSASPAPPVSSWSSAGAPLPSTTRQRLENSFSLDLSPVRVHSDSHASGVADSMRAYAFAYGSHIYLGSGQSAYNLGLMAHEVTHVVQQQGRPAFQMSSALAVGDRFESEAGSVSAAVVRGEHALVHERTSFPRFQGSAWDRFTSAVGSAASAVGRGVSAAAGAVVSAVAEIGSGLLNAAYNYLKGRARAIPGYDLLGFVLGRDPITQEPIERNASNLIHAVLGLVPGGAEMWTNLQQANVINRVFEWLDPELAKLNLTWPIIRGLFQQAWNAFSLADAVANPGRVWDAMRDIFAPPLGRLVNFARAAGGKILEFIFEGALALGGSAAQRVLAIFRRGQAVFRLIVADPMRFVRNLVAAGVGGFRRFAANILDHLRTALFEWLLGALAGAGLQLPQRWDFMGILSVVLQVLGLTYARIRERFVRLIGEPAVHAIEVGFEFLRIIVTQGLAAAWEKILEFATGMIDTVIEGIKSWVVRSIVGAAVTRLATMFNPVGAVIQAIIATYNTVMFFIERANQIATMVESYLTSIENIAQGNLEAAIAYVERAMARTLPVIISFLARLIGLGGISDTIRGIIQRIQATVDRAIDRVIEWIRTRAASILARVTGRGDQAGAAGDVRSQAREQLRQRLTPTTTQPQAEAAVRDIHGRLRSGGLRRLELGPEREDGTFPIIAEASPPSEILAFAPANASVRMAATMTLSGTAPLTENLGQELLVGGRAPVRFGPWGRHDPETDTSLPSGSAASLPLAHRFSAQPRWSRGGREDQLHERVGGAIVQPTPGSNELQVSAWNVGNPVLNSNTSHAEHQFVQWFTSRDRTWRLRVIRLSVCITHSPCTLCAIDLRRIRAAAPNIQSLTLVYNTRYTRGRNRTTDSSLTSMGWDSATMGNCS